jgi:hypothetical protein
MTTDARDAQDILAAALALSPQEQLEGLQGLVESLAQTFSPLESVAASFWAHRSIEGLAREQHIPVVTNLQALAVPEWPSDETAQMTSSPICVSSGARMQRLNRTEPDNHRVVGYRCGLISLQG